jgi:tetratricopeptide (TPR) repeat protein
MVTTTSFATGLTSIRNHRLVRPPSFCLLGLLTAALLLPGAHQARADERNITAASSLMDRGQYGDAIKLLEKSLEQQGPDNSTTELRLIGECQFLLKDYGKARTAFSRALANADSLSPKARIVCESRLAIIDYRLGDKKGADERIENFIRKYPKDSRVGTMAVIRIRITQEDSTIPLAEKIRKVEEQHKVIAADKEAFGYYNAVLAAQALGDLYIENKQEDKAVGLLVTAVHEMRGLITELKGKGKAIPSDLGQGVDGMALQIARYNMSRKEWGEAKKWLENVDYAEDLKAQAKYMLAQIAYQRREFAEALFQLPDEVVARIAEGDTKNAMYLLMAFCWREPATANAEKAKEALKKIPPASSSYCQAQQTLGDIYREQKDHERAEPCYLNALNDKEKRFAAAARFGLGVGFYERATTILLMGATDEMKKQREALCKKSAEHFQELLTKYPNTDLARQAKPMIEKLQNWGIIVVVEATEKEQIAAKEKLIAENPNSFPAAQAMLWLAQLHAKAVQDPKTKNLLKAPNWEACAKACLPLVQSKTPFANVTPEWWRDNRCIALFLLARAELGSIPPGASARRLRPNQAEPVRIKTGGSAVRALQNLTEAQTLVTPQTNPDVTRNLEFATIEAMLKSPDAVVRSQGEKRYAAVESKYSLDPVYQKLAIITADWQDEQGFYEDAGRIYRSVARKATMDRDQSIHLLHLAGASYGRGGRALIEKREKNITLGIQILPRIVLRTGTTNTQEALSALKRTKLIPWEPTGPTLSAAEAVARISREFSVPLVWSPEVAPGSVAAFLAQTTIPRETVASWRQSMTFEKALYNVLDRKEFSVVADIGLSGGTLTFIPKLAELGDTDDQVLEIVARQRERFAPLARMYGSFATVHGKPAMMFNVIKRVEELTGARIMWGEGIQKDEALSRDFPSFPGVAPASNLTVRAVLDKTLEAVGLRYEVVPCDHSRELIMESISCFDELRKFGADTTYAEDAMFNIAVNLYVIRDYAKMKLLLKEYLKTYDNPSFAHYYDACYWLGRLFEIERNYREALKYYGMAADEKIIIFHSDSGAPTPTIEELKARLSYDTLYNLSRKGNGSFTDATIDREFLSFVRFHTNLEILIDPSAKEFARSINRPSFVGVPCLNLIHEVLVANGLDLRTENGDKGVAEKAYYRMALVYKEDNLMREALENVQTLLTRFPQSPRRVDALSLKLEIYKGLRNYSEVLKTLEQLKACAGGRIAPFQLDYEIGRVYFDLCNYTNAMDSFVQSIGGTQNPQDWLPIRSALAQTYLRMPGREPDALALYRQNITLETAPLAQTINAMTIYWLEYALLPAPRTRKPVPAAEAEFMTLYTKASDSERADLSQGDVARATWIYYLLGRMDLVDSNNVAALEKFNAAGSSPDAYLSGDALYQAALIHAGRAEFDKTRECLEHLLFTTKSVEASVKGTYELARCQKTLGNLDAAFQRYDELVTRYPVSPYADLVRQEPLYLQRKPAVPLPPAATPAAASPAATNTGGARSP